MKVVGIDPWVIRSNSSAGGKKSFSTIRYASNVRGKKIKINLIAHN